MHPRRLRVLQVVLDLEAGGLERLVADLVRRFDPATIESHVLALRFLGRYAEGLEGVAALHTGRPLPPWSMIYPGPLIEQIREIAPDVVHTHSGVWYKGSLGARLAGVPAIVHTDHGRQHPDPWADRIVDRWAARRTDRVIAVSEVLGAQLARTVVTDSSRIRVIINGVDTSLYRIRESNGRLRTELGLSPDTPLIGSLGRLDHIKGYDVMVESFAAFQRIRSPGPAPVLLIAGDGPDRVAIESLIAERGLTGQARVLGWRSDVHDLLASLTLFTLTSRSEGTSVSLMEAMSSGLCPVVTRVGGNADVLGPDLAHRLVPSERPADIAEGWKKALADPALRTHDAHVARARVVERYSLDRMVREYAEVYQELAAKGGESVQGTSPRTVT